MRLLLKFNLVFLLFFLAGLGASMWIANDLLQQNAKQEVLEHARLTMEKAIAVRSYTIDQIQPLLQTQMVYTFLPQSVPAYAATEVLHQLSKAFPDYTYKEATLNPTNPRDRAVDWETDLIGRFRTQTDLKELIGERESALGRVLYIARPLKIVNPACLLCHDTIERAPKTVFDKYGPANGFGWKLNETVGAQIVTVPMTVPLARAHQTFKVFVASLVGIFVTLGVVGNLMLWAVVIRPVTRLARGVDRVSLGEADVPEFAARGKDEISLLAQSTTRLRRSLEQAMRMLES